MDRDVIVTGWSDLQEKLLPPERKTGEKGEGRRNVSSHIGGFYLFGGIDRGLANLYGLCQEPPEDNHATFSLGPRTEPY
jgi:hypothetical protein